MEGVDDELDGEKQQEHRGDAKEKAEVDAVTVARPGPGERGGERQPGNRTPHKVQRVGLPEERRRDECGLHPLTGDHEDDEEKDAQPCGALGPARRRFEPCADLLPHQLCRAQHVNHHGDDQHCGDQRKQRLPLGQHCYLGEPHAEHHRGDHRHPGTPAHGRK